jgi:hypothetical protein
MSVCILHRDGWAATDSRVSGCGTIYPLKIQKAFVNNGWLIATVGEGILHTRMQQIACMEHEMPDAVSQTLQEKDAEGCLLMLNKARDIIHVDGLGSFDYLDKDLVDFWAIGCADHYVLGYLRRIVETEARAITPDDATAAIKSAARYDAGIDDRVQIVYLNQ